MMKRFAKTIVQSPATFIIVVLLLLLTLLVTVRATPVNQAIEAPLSNSVQLDTKASLK